MWHYVSAKQKGSGRTWKCSPRVAITRGDATRNVALRPTSSSRASLRSALITAATARRDRVATCLLLSEPRFVARNKHNLIVHARNTDEFSVMLRGSCQMRRPFSNASLPVTQARPLSAFRDSAGSSGVLHADSARRRAMRKTPSKRSSSTFGRARPALIVPSRVKQRSSQ